MENENNVQITKHDLDVVLSAIKAACDAFETSFPSRRFINGFDREQYEALQEKLEKLA